MADTIFNKGGSVPVERNPDVDKIPTEGGCNVRKDGLTPTLSAELVEKEIKLADILPGLPEHYEIPTGMKVVSADILPGQSISYTVGDEHNATSFGTFSTGDGAIVRKPLDTEPGELDLRGKLLPPVAGNALEQGWAALDRHVDTPLTPPRIPVEQALETLFDHIGEDKTREGLSETPARWRKAWATWASGYDTDPLDIIKTFEDGAERYDEFVIMNDIPFYSHCEHHLAPFFGRASVGYIPNGKVIGLSKLNRIVDCFARRLQTQERITQQVAHFLFDNLQARGVGVILKARHLCVESRGIAQQGGVTTTSCLLGACREDPAVRAEYIQLAEFKASI